MSLPLQKNGAPALKVAIVHDWLIGGGAERVVEELHRMFPDAPIYTSYCTPQWRERLDNKVVTGFLQHFGALRKYLALGRIWWFTHLDFSGYDLVISSSGNGEAMGVRVPSGTLHISYCHTPTHYYWRHYDQYMKHPGFGVFDPLARVGLRLLLGALRRWDLKASTRPNYLIANSTHIQSDIKKYYGRDSVVIHPPVDVSRFTVNTGARSGFVTVGRQAPAKHTDVIVAACTRLGLPLTVVGRGPEHKRLVRLAGPTVTFDAQASDADVAHYMASAQAFIFASFDDFGITPVEALAAGTPLIAYKAGGALDYVEPGVTGEFFARQTAASLEKTLQAFKPGRYKPALLRQRSEQYSPEHFRRELLALIDSVTKPA